MILLTIGYYFMLISGPRLGHLTSVQIHLFEPHTSVHHRMYLVEQAQFVGSFVSVDIHVVLRTGLEPALHP